MVFIALQGTALMICSVALFALVTTIGYIVYLDRADNGGELVYKRLEKIFPFLTIQKHSTWHWWRMCGQCSHGCNSNVK